MNSHLKLSKPQVMLNTLVELKIDNTPIAKVTQK